MTTGPFDVADAMKRVSDHAPIFELVGTAADLRTALAQKPRRTPAVYVVAQERGRPVKYSGPTLVQQDVEVALQAVLFVRNVNNERTGAGAAAEMADCIRELRAAWIGWAPDDTTDAVSFQAGRDESYDGGHLVSQQIFATAYRYAHEVIR